MDAFAVSICKGLSSHVQGTKTALVCGIWFGVFQSLMSLIGFLVGSSFAAYISAIDHWIAFILLVLIGANMIREALKGTEELDNSSLSPKAMFPLAVATSIDALAAGVSLAMTETSNIWINILIIGAVTFIISAIGAKFGTLFGRRFQKRAQIAGGVILILLGVKTLVEHLFG